MAYEFVKGLDCEEHRDEVLSAAIIHDLRKQGITHSGHTVKNHADLAVNLIDEVQEATQLLTKQQHDLIRRCVAFHYGPWSEDPWKKSMDNYTREELALYLSDFTVSKRFITTDYRRD